MRRKFGLSITSPSLKTGRSNRDERSDLANFERVASPEKEVC